MPRGSLSKVDMLHRIYKLKDRLYYQIDHHELSQSERNAADQMLNQVLDILNEYSH
jgi:hypothetical protein